MISAREATKVAQVILAQVKPGLKVDGWWGTYTNEAFFASSSIHQEAVRLALRSAGTSPEQLLAATRVTAAGARALGTGWIAEDYAFSLADRAASEVGIAPQVMRSFLLLEAARTVRDGKTFFNAGSVSPNGLYRGLFQMGEAAWADARKRAGDIPPYSSVFDPWHNTRAAAVYVQSNMRVASSMGYSGEFTPEVLYAMHNQGVAGFLRILRERRVNANVVNQSPDARRVIRVAAGQNGVHLA